MSAFTKEELALGKRLFDSQPDSPWTAFCELRELFGSMSLERRQELYDVVAKQRRAVVPSSNREETARVPNTLKVGDKVYFVTVPWRQDLPEVIERTVTQSSQKQIRLDGYGPNISGVFWIDENGKPRHGDCGDEPAFYPTRVEAIAAFKRSVASKRTKALAVLATCDVHDAWIGEAS